MLVSCAKRRDVKTSSSVQISLMSVEARARFTSHASHEFILAVFGAIPFFCYSYTVALSTSDEPKFKMCTMDMIISRGDHGYLLSSFFGKTVFLILRCFNPSLSQFSFFHYNHDYCRVVPIQVSAFTPSSCSFHEFVSVPSCRSPSLSCDMLLQVLPLLFSMKQNSVFSLRETR